MNRPVIVTGASGFVGAHLSMSLAQGGLRVIAVGGRNPVPQTVAAICTATRNVDLTNPDESKELISEFEPGAIVHAAALANTSSCQNDPEAAQKHNVHATSHLLQAAFAAAVRPFFLFISTDMVFDGAPPAPAGGFDENSEPHPVSIYSKSKLAAEELVRSAELDALVLRIALVYGKKIEHLEGFMAWLCKGLSADGVRLFLDEFRTPVSTEDIGEAIKRLIQASERGSEAGAGPSRLFHIAGPDRVSRVELGELVAKTFNLPTTKIQPCLRSDAPSPIPRPHDISLSSKKIERALGIQCRTLADGLRELNSHSA